jgi:hypothetical protein
MYLVEASICYLCDHILNSEDCFYHKYIHAVLWKAKFKVVYHTQYSSYQYCSSIHILGIVLIHEVLLGMQIFSSNSASLYMRWMYLLHQRMSCSLFRVRI